MIRLDTHVMVWLYTGEVERFGDAAQVLLAEDDLVICPIVELELTYLHEIGRLAVGGPSIVSDLRERIGVGTSTQQMSAVVAAADQLSWTRDPFDRLIVGDAMAAGCRLLTKDATILDNCQLAVW